MRDSPEPMRAGVVGAGLMGGWHAAAAARAGARIAAVIDPDVGRARRLAQKYRGATSAALLEEVLSPSSLDVLHVCGEGVHFDEFVDYPVHAVSWALAQGNPSLAEGRRRTGRAVMGGLPAKPVIATLAPDVLAARARAAVDALSGRWLLLGPDCSINPDTPESLLHAVRVARDDRAGGVAPRS